MDTLTHEDSNTSQFSIVNADTIHECIYEAYTRMILDNSHSGIVFN